jgi:hypothetical protein
MYVAVAVASAGGITGTVIAGCVAVAVAGGGSTASSEGRLALLVLFRISFVIAAARRAIIFFPISAPSRFLISGPDSGRPLVDW